MVPKKGKKKPPSHLPKKRSPKEPVPGQTAPLEPGTTPTFLGIPIGPTNLVFVKNAAVLYIVATADCSWCFSDLDNCFPNNTFLAAGFKPAMTVYGPFTAASTGTVLINAVPSPPNTAVPCTPELGPLSGHTITVGGP